VIRALSLSVLTNSRSKDVANFVKKTQRNTEEEIERREALA
jgi:hypothetical protein